MEGQLISFIFFEMHIKIAMNIIGMGVRISEGPL